MIDIVSSPELARLAEAHEGPCVSIYLPTHRAGQQMPQDQIRLKNALTEAHRELEALGVRGVDADALLRPLAELRDRPEFWAHLEGGLAVFASRGGAHTYRVADPVAELVVVADRFHIKPLVPLVATGSVFHVLTLSQKRVRLLRGSRHQLSEIGLGEIPSSLAEALWFDDREAQLQSHSAQRVGTGQVTATFHGHGAGVDTKESDLVRFLSAVSGGVEQIIGTGPAPLVLAGVASTAARFRHVSTHRHIVEGGVEGSVESLGEAELHARAWPLVAPVFEESRRRARASAEGGGIRTTRAVRDALIAAHNGQVASVFVPVGVHRWGTFDEDALQVDEHDERSPGDRDLLDAIAVETLTHGGEVFAVAGEDVPGAGLVAASLRF